MRLRETEYHVHEDDDLQDSIDQWMEEDGVHEVRIEIHSLDDEWTESAPDGWGPGWPFRIGDTVMIAADDGQDQHELEILAFVPSTGRIQRVNVLDIEFYGRKG